MWIRVFVSVCLIVTVQSDDDNSTEVFSLPPSNIPVTKVDVLGQQVFVRQPFHLPKREVRSSQEVDDITSKIFSPFLASVDGMISSTTTTTTTKKPEPLRSRRQYGSGGYATSDNYYVPKPKYPLPQCYTNKAGFMCCNKKLENLIHDTFANLAADPKFNTCNNQKIANQIQDEAQKAFKTDFEVLSGVGDFASKTHFYSDLICKTEKEGRFLMAYGTPNRHFKPPTPPSEPPPYRKFRDALNIAQKMPQTPIIHTVFI